MAVEGNPFAAISDYDLHNLVAHYGEARRGDVVHRLLELPTNAGRNGWYEAQLERADTDAYLADVARAWELAAETQDVGLEVRYALITSTLNSRAQNVPPELAVAALTQGLWSERRTVAFVRQLQDPAARAGALAAVAPHVDETLRDEVLTDLLSAMAAAASEGTLSAAMFSALPDELPEPVVDQVLELARSLRELDARATALRVTALRLSEPARNDAFRAALAAVRDIPPGATHLNAMTGLLPELPDDLRPDAASNALKAALERAPAELAPPRLAVLMVLAPQLSEAELEAALKLVRSLTSWEERVDAVDAIAAHLPAPLLGDAVERARSARSNPERAATLAVLALHHPEPVRRELQGDALAFARAIPVHQGRAKALARLVGSLHGSDRSTVVDETLEALRGQPYETAGILVQLAPHLSDPQFEAALALVRTSLEPGGRTEVLAAFWQHAPSHLKRSVLLRRLAAARAEDHEPFRIEALATLLPLLSPAARMRAAREALEAARSLESGTFRAGELAALAPHVPEALLSEAIEAAETIGDHGPRSLLLLALARDVALPLEPEVLREAIAVARERQNFRERVPILVALGPHLKPELLAEALEAVDARLGDVGSDRVDHGVDSATAAVLAPLAPHLPDELLPEALDLARTIGYLAERAQALAALAPYLPAPLLHEALAAAREIPPGAHSDGRQGGWLDHRVDALAGLAPHLPEPERSEAFEEALAAARAIPSGRGVAEQLVLLVPRLPEPRRGDVGADAVAAVAAGDLPDSGAAEALAALAQHLREPALADATKTARGFHDDEARAGALVALADRLPPDGRAATLNEALDSARRARDDTTKVSLLAEIAALLDQPAQRSVVLEALAIATAIDYQGWGTEKAAIRLAPLLEPQERNALLDQALEGALSLASAGLEPDPRKLLALTPVLAPAAAMRALREALAIALREGDPSDPSRPAHVDLPPLEAIPPETLRAIWSPTLRALVSDSRPFLLQRLCDLVPLLVAIGDKRAAETTRAAVVAVTAWWP